MVNCRYLSDLILLQLMMTINYLIKFNSDICFSINLISSPNIERETHPIFLRILKSKLGYKI